MNRDDATYAIIPMGAVALVNLLVREGWEVRGINLGLERSLDPQFDLQTSGVIAFHPDLLLVDLHWYMTAAGAFDAIRTLHERVPQTYVVVGGMTASFFDTEALQLCPEIDVVLRGDSERGLLMIAREIKQGRPPVLDQVANATYRDSNARIRRSPVTWRIDQDLFNELDFVTIDWLDHCIHYYQTDISGYASNQRRRYWLEVGRGCFFNCTMCGGGLYAHRELSSLAKPMWRDARRVADDLTQLYEKGVEQVAFSHDIFALKYPPMPDLADYLRRSPIDLGVLHEYWRLPTDDTIDFVYGLFNPALSQVALSPESGNEMVRRRNFPSKFFTNKQLLERLGHLSRYEQDVEIFFAANLPWETTATWQEALALMGKVVSIYGMERLIAYAGFITIDPASPMWNDPSGFEISRDFNGLADYYRMTLQGRRVPGFHSLGLSVSDVSWDLRLFREAVCGLKEGTRALEESADI